MISSSFLGNSKHDLHGSTPAGAQELGNALGREGIATAGGARSRRSPGALHRQHHGAVNRRNQGESCVAGTAPEAPESSGINISGPIHARSRAVEEVRRDELRDEVDRRCRISVLTFHCCINYGSYREARCLVEGLRVSATTPFSPIIGPRKSTEGVLSPFPGERPGKWR